MRSKTSSMLCRYCATVDLTPSSRGCRLFRDLRCSRRQRTSKAGSRLKGCARHEACNISRFRAPHIGVDCCHAARGSTCCPHRYHEARRHDLRCAEETHTSQLFDTNDVWTVLALPWSPPGARTTHFAEHRESAKHRGKVVSRRDF